MTAELIISIVSISLSTIVGIWTLIVNSRMKKLEHLDKIQKYDKNITNFELQYKDEDWFKNIMKSGEFRTFNEESQMRIEAWWEEYQKNHVIAKIVPTVEVNELRRKKPKKRNARFRMAGPLKKLNPTRIKEYSEQSDVDDDTDFDDSINW